MTVTKCKLIKQIGKEQGSAMVVIGSMISCSTRKWFRRHNILVVNSIVVWLVRLVGRLPLSSIFYVELEAY